MEDHCTGPILIDGRVKMKVNVSYTELFGCSISFMKPQAIIYAFA